MDTQVTSSGPPPTTPGERTWSTRVLLVAASTVVALGLGAGAALGAVSGGQTSGGPGGGGPGGQPPGQIRQHGVPPGGSASQ